MMPAKGRIPLHDYSAQRIVLIKPRALGDIIHSFPLLTALRRRYASAHISFLVNRTYECSLCGHPDLDEPLPFDRGASRCGWRQAVLTRGRRLGRRGGTAPCIVRCVGS
jgi:ADP-heptose:LPS heptosyltransferase